MMSIVAYLLGYRPPPELLGPLRFLVEDKPAPKPETKPPAKMPDRWPFTYE
jgi:hypothetical protein